MNYDSIYNNAQKLKEATYKGYTDDQEFGDPGYYDVTDDDLHEYEDTSLWNNRAFNRALKSGRVSKENLKKYLSRPETVRHAAGFRDLIPTDNSHVGNLEVNKNLSEEEYRNAEITSLKFNIVPISDQILDKAHGNAFKAIPFECFKGVKGLANQTVRLPHGLEKIGSSAFEDTDIGTLIIPATVRHICKNAFENSKIKNIILEGSTEELKGFYYPDGCASMSSGLRGKVRIYADGEYLKTDQIPKIGAISKIPEEIVLSEPTEDLVFEWKDL